MLQATGNNIRLGAAGVLVVCLGLLGAVLPASVSYGQTTIWPKFRHNLQNTAQSPFTGPALPGVSWQVDTGSNIVSSAAIGRDGVSYVGTFAGDLYAINPDGTERWVFDLGANSILSSPAIDDEGFIYFGADNNIFYALDPAGALAWNFAADGPVRSSPAVLDNVAYFGTENGSVYAVVDEGGTGEPIWQFFPTGRNNPGAFFSSPAIRSIPSQEVLTVFIGSADGVLYAIEGFSGEQLWTFQTGGPIESSPTVDGNGTVFVGSQDGNVYAVNDGQLQWQTRIGSAVQSSPALSDGTLYVGADNGNLYALNSANGAILWNFPTGDAVFSSPAVGDDGTIYVGSDDGNLYAVRPNGQLLWDIPLGQTIASSPSISSDPIGKNTGRPGANTIIVSTFEGTIFAVGPAAPRLIIESIEPSTIPTLDIGEALTYTITVVDQGGTPVAGAAVDVNDGLLEATFTRSPTDANGQITYRTVAPDGRPDGRYDLTFVARANGFENSDPVVRQVDVVDQTPPQLAIQSITPSGIPELDVGGSIVYTITVVDRDTNEPVTGAVVDVDDEIQGRVLTTAPTDANGQTRYQAVVPNGTADGRYTLSFVARAGDFIDSGPVNRQIDVVNRAPGLAVEPAAVDFSLMLLGDTSNRAVSIRNTGNQQLNVDVVQITGGDAGDFSLPQLNLPLNIAPNGSVNITLGFTPSRRGQRNAVLEVDSDGGMMNVPLSGEGAAPGIGVEPGALAFGTVDVGAMADETVAITNTGNASLTINGVSIGGADGAAFTVVSGGGQRVLAPGGTHNVGVRFAPQRAGGHTASLDIDSDATDDAGTPIGVRQVPLTGEGMIVAMPALTATPDILQYGEIILGTTSGEQGAAIDNTGNVDLNIQIALVGADAGAFAIVRGGGAGVLAPADPPRDLAVVFTPTRLGEHEAAVRILWDGSQTLIQLRGTGVAASIEEPQADPANDGAQVGIRVAVPPGFTPATRQLFFRLGGETTYRQVDMQENAAGALEGVIPPQFVTERGLEYYVLLANAAATLTFPAVDPENNPIILSVAVETIQVGGVFQPAVYRMVSVPLVLAGAAVQNLVDDYGPPDPAEWRVLRWQSAEEVYQEVPRSVTGGPRFSPGQAVWLITRAGQSFDVIDGTSVDTSEPFVIVLPPGWSQIAVPFAFPVAVSSIIGMEAVQGPYFYDGTEYQPNQTVLLPWEGYFVLNPGAAPVTLLVPPVELTSAAGKQSGPDDLFPEAGYVMQLRASVPDHRWRDTQNYVGFADAATIQPEAFNLPEPPPIGDHLRLSILDDGQHHISRFAPPDGGGQQWDLEIEAVLQDEIRFAPKTVRVALAERGQRPDGFDLYVFDRDLGRVLSIENGAFEVVLTAEYPVRHLSLVLGTTAFAEAHSEGASLTPTEFVLEANYPNPFNPETVIRYGLNQQSDVDLAIYNVLGQRVRTLVAAEQNSGRYEVVWDGLDDAGRPAASGVYIYQLRAGSFLDSQTMLLVR